MVWLDRLLEIIVLPAAEEAFYPAMLEGSAWVAARHGVRRLEAQVETDRRPDFELAGWRPASSSKRYGPWKRTIRNRTL